MTTMISRIALLSVFGAALAVPSIAPNPAQAQTKCPKVQQADISQLFDRWNNSLQTGNPDRVVLNYAKDGILLPTVSNKVRHNHGEIKEYFVKFLELKPQGKINERNVRIFCGVAIDSGVYTFSLTKNGQPESVTARYTFVYRKIGNQWLIVEHHSSAMPEKIAASSQE